MTLTRSNRIPPTRQREIEAAAAKINADDLGPFSARYLDEEVLSYMSQGRAFCVVMKNDAEFLSLLEQNYWDCRSPRLCLAPAAAE
jgi:hypothetical protein